MPFLDDEEQRKQLIKELTAELQDRQAVALSHATDLLGWEVSVSSLHGKIGGKNVTYADCANRQYANFQDFFATWLQGFNDLCELRNVKPGQGGSLSDILILLSDKAIYEYTEIFLERNFIKNYKARVRYKPEESLWKVWFGNSLVFGLFIAPELCPDGTVRTDKSEIRRASYNFWTVGHVATTGLYDPDNKIFIRFNSRNDFFQFYDGILKRLSQSDYERGIYERYINYLSQSADIMSEPLLIPEFRYEGAERSCKYRVDFAVLNPYTGQAIGYELSPASSHMSVSGQERRKVL